MTKSELALLKQLVRKLNACREIADRLELLAGNGAEFGSIIGGIADELEVKISAVSAA